MSKFIKLVILLISSFSVIACNDPTSRNTLITDASPDHSSDVSSPDGDTDADMDSDTDTDADSDTDSDADGDSDTDTDSDVDTDTDTDADSDSDTDSDTDTDSDADGDTCVYSCQNHCFSLGGNVMDGTCSNPEQKCCDMGGDGDTDADSDSDTDTDSDSDSDTDSDSDSDTDTDSDIQLDPVDVEADITVDIFDEKQTIRGFGGMNCPTWISDLSSDQVDTAFGNGPGQIGLSILRIMVPPNSFNFDREVKTAQRASEHGAIVLATPWSPPQNLKSNNNIVGGRLNENAYDAYADHLLSFRDHLASSGVDLYAISVQNEPDIDVSYDSCYWSPDEMINWLSSQASKFGDTKLMVAESFNYNKTKTDPILNNATAEPLFDIVGVHLYGASASDYPLAREKGKELWMTEHYTDSNNDANLWPMALDVAKEIHSVMASNFNAYIWWYIRRSYGPITENGQVSKRGYMMAQYAKFARPGAIRVETEGGGTAGGMWGGGGGGPLVTAYKDGGKLVIVLVNTENSEQTKSIGINAGAYTSFKTYTSSGSKNLEEGEATATGNVITVTLDGQSVTTLVGESN